MTPSDHAQAAADAIRQLNHATVADSATIGEVHDVLGELRTLCSRLPHALDQAARIISDRHASGTLTLDHEGPVIEAVQGVRSDLRLAADHLNFAAWSISAAQQTVSHLIDEGP
jgi:hypothetical protein